MAKTLTGPLPEDWCTFSSAHGLSITNSPTVVRGLPITFRPAA